VVICCLLDAASSEVEEILCPFYRTIKPNLTLQRPPDILYYDKVILSCYSHEVAYSSCCRTRLVLTGVPYSSCCRTRLALTGVPYSSCCRTRLALTGVPYSSCCRTRLVLTGVPYTTRQTHNVAIDPSGVPKCANAIFIFLGPTLLHSSVYFSIFKKGCIQKGFSV